MTRKSAEWNDLSLAQIKLLALDLDGTLLTNSKTISERTTNALHNAIALGVQIAVVTGRPLMGLPDSMMAFPGIRYAITSNGAVTTELETDKILRAVSLDKPSALEIAQLPMKRGLIHNVFIGGIGYCEPQYFEMLQRRFRGTSSEPYIRKSKRSVKSVKKLIEAAAVGVENIWIIAHATAERDELDDLIKAKWAVKTVLTGPLDLEVGAPEANKGAALRDLAAMLNMTMPEVAAIGNNENDLGMLLASGVSFAMTNATDRVKQLASFVTDSNKEDGAAKVIEAICATYREF